MVGERYLLMYCLQGELHIASPWTTLTWSSSHSSTRSSGLLHCSRQIPIYLKMKLTDRNFCFTHFQFPAGSNLHFSVALIKFWKCVLHWMCFEYTGRERHTQMHFQFQFSDHYWYWSTIIGRSLYMYTKKSNTIVFTKVQHNYQIGKVLSHTQILVKAP